MQTLQRNDCGGGSFTLLGEVGDHHSWIPPSRLLVSRGLTGRQAGAVGGEGRTHLVDVVVTVGDNAPLGAFGTQTVLSPVESTEGDEPRRWLPSAVSWAPDSSALRFVGWELLASGDAGAGNGLLIVPVDRAATSTILWETPEGIGPMSIVLQNDFQAWSR